MAEELHIEPTGLSFVLRVQQASVRFQGGALGDRLYGTVDMGSLRLGLFLAPIDTRESAGR
jgi:hypothetical protein